MNSQKRLNKVNSLLKEVISEVIRDKVRDPKCPILTTVTNVEVSRDLRHAKVLISIIGDEKGKTEGLRALNNAATYISLTASKRVTLRYFPSLRFQLDTSIEKYEAIERLLNLSPLPSPGYDSLHPDRPTP